MTRPKSRLTLIRAKLAEFADSPTTPQEHRKWIELLAEAEREYQEARERSNHARALRLQKTNEKRALLEKLHTDTEINPDTVEQIKKQDGYEL